MTKRSYIATELSIGAFVNYCFNAVLGIFICYAAITIFLPEWLYGKDPLIATTSTAETVYFWSVLCVFGAALVYYGYVQIRARRLLKKRGELLDLLAIAHGWKRGASPQDQMKFSNASLLDIGTRDEHITNIVKAPEWIYAEYSYALYNHTKYGDYKAKTIRYAMMSVQLPRELPNVFFDSVQVRGRQFHKKFDPSQLHTLEGDFSTFFNTYFAPTYTIDSLSFITPEVMIALRDAADYDIEIIGNQVLLYGPLYAPQEQIDDMSQKLLLIRDKLLNNITTYRDDRLPYAEGRQRVAPLGMALKRRRLYWSLVINAVIIIVWIVGNFVVAYNKSH